MSHLSHLIYASAAAPGLDATGLDAILAVTRRNNTRRGVTGMLLFASGSFFQVLEGDDVTLREVFATIGADPRHGRVTKIIEEPITHRAFADWSMGFSRVDAGEMPVSSGLAAFFRGGGPVSEIQPGRARKLLAAFSQGRWRSRVAGP